MGGGERDGFSIRFMGFFFGVCSSLMGDRIWLERGKGEVVGSFGIMFHGGRVGGGGLA